ncbi:DUF3810 domain-containing protein [Phocaeicola sp.]
MKKKLLAIRVKALTILRYALPLILLLFIVLCRFNPSLAEGYARSVYPVSSVILSAVSSVFPFSLEEILVIGIILWMIIYPIVKRRKGKKWKTILGREVELLVWVYIWFYLGWGLNYFRYNIYTRAQVPPAQYEEQAFLQFLNAYTDSLNHSYIADMNLDTKRMDQEIKDFYRRVPKTFGLVKPKDYQKPKFFTFTPLYSGVGVLGSMGPFFAESQLNKDLLPTQLPFTYAHELSHLLGVSNEAEANYWAYQVCIHSASPQMRYSGYFGLLPYVLINASYLLPEDEFQEWVKTIRPEIVEEYEQKRAYWKERYSPLIGELQDCIYDWFLKGNQIPSGKKNYAEVISILLSCPEVSR